MANSRKRARKISIATRDARKRFKVECDDNTVGSALVEHPTLCLYYHRVMTLRDFLLASLASTSRTRRRKITSIGRNEVHITRDTGKSAPSLQARLPNQSILGEERCLATLLDYTLVCAVRDESPIRKEPLEKDFASFSQQANPSTGSSNDVGSTTISEIVDFAIWFLFHRMHVNTRRPMHLLCHGYHRTQVRRQINGEKPAIPGVVSHYPNNHVSTLKSAIWAEVLSLPGKEGDGIILDLILNFDVYVSVDSGKNNYYQLCGTPMSELQPLSTAVISSTLQHFKPSPSRKVQSGLKQETISPVSPKVSAAIYFVRHRMFYARATLNAKGNVSLGLRHIHVLNRYSDSRNLASTIHIIKYIFPRQFGLHNAFTSTHNPRETTHPFKDYTLREQEIASTQGKTTNAMKPHLPKRLRGAVVNLVQKLQILHSRCAYKELLDYYCPWNGSNLPQRVAKGCAVYGTSQQNEQLSDARPRMHALMKVPQPADAGKNASLIPFATATADVSAFCRAVFAKLIPRAFWGDGPEGSRNQAVVMQNVNRFIHLGRHERLSLHTVSQGLKLGPLSWLAPPSVKPTSKIAKSDLQKRNEIFLEFVYYVFDSLLIPLVRCNFHVTESNVHGNRLFFFRHDIWRRATEPYIATIKLNMFEEIKTLQAKTLLDARVLGFSQLRLLPKSFGVRPIMNLRRRTTRLQDGKPTIGRSINQVMAPVFNMFDYEKRKQPTRLGSALFAVGDLYPKLKGFQDHLRCVKADRKTLYFAKCDVQSCFDTIPQRKIVKLMETMASEDEYKIAFHAEIKSSRIQSSSTGMDKDPHPERRFLATAQATTNFETFDQAIRLRLARSKKNTVFVDKVVPYVHRKETLLDLLQEHIERNIVKIGKKFFRQKAGIPQGSVLSSLLCSYFYAELEKESLGFLDEKDEILLRLIDDFLLITTNKKHAIRFLQVMHDGIEQYGVKVNPAKSLVNFEVTVNGVHIPRLAGDTGFPYCGSIIDTRTLEITKDRDRRKNTGGIPHMAVRKARLIGVVLLHSMTIERSKTPGKNFHHKALSAFKNLTHKMFLDTTFNSLSTVLSTIHMNFLESAMKYYRYAKCMATGKYPHAALLIGTIQDVVDLAFVLVKAKSGKQIVHDYKCAVSKRQVEWLAAKAFQHVLSRKQSNYVPVLTWLEDVAKRSAPPCGKELVTLGRIVKEGEAVYCGYKY